MWRQRMFSNRRAYLVLDVKIDADHTSLAQRLAKRRMKHQRAALQHPCLDDYVGTYAVNHLLQTDQVLGHLQYRPAEPTEVVVVAQAPAHPHPFV